MEVAGVRQEAAGAVGAHQEEVGAAGARQEEVGVAGVLRSPRSGQRSTSRYVHAHSSLVVEVTDTFLGFAQRAAYGPRDQRDGHCCE